MRGRDRGSDGDDGNGRDDHQNVDPDGIREIPQLLHELRIGGQEIHIARSLRHDDGIRRAAAPIG